MRFLSVLFVVIGLSACAVTPDVWRPYPSSQDVSSAEEGWYEGDRIPNLLFKTADGTSRVLSDYKGKVLFVNFWGSWCEHSEDEIPKIQELYNEVNHPDIEFIMLNVWERFEKSQEWLTQHNFNLPFYDSMSGSNYDKKPLTLSTDKQIRPFRAVPRTFVVDKNGIIVYRRNKSKSNWPEYKEALLDLATENNVYP